MTYITSSNSSCKFEISRRGFYFATAGYVAFEMPSESKTGTEQCYRIETRTNWNEKLYNYPNILEIIFPN
jgi:hypothetical protein